MKTTLWTVDFDTGKRMYVSASTVKIAIHLAVWGYNKDMDTKLNSSNITAVQKGKIE